MRDLEAQYPGINLLCSHIINHSHSFTAMGNVWDKLLADLRTREENRDITPDAETIITTTSTHVFASVLESTSPHLMGLKLEQPAIEFVLQCDRPVRGWMPLYPLPAADVKPICFLRSFYPEYRQPQSVDEGHLPASCVIAIQQHHLLVPISAHTILSQSATLTSN